MISDKELKELIRYMYSLVESETGREVIDKELNRKYGVQYQNIRDNMEDGFRPTQPYSSRK